MSKNRFIKKSVYAFIEYHGIFEDYYFRTYNEAIEYLRSRISSIDPLQHGTVMDSAISFDKNKIFIVTKTKVESLSYIESKYGSVEDYILGLEKIKINWLKEGF